jgi:hypothetical protein
VQGEPEFHAGAGVLQVDVEEFGSPREAVAHGVVVDLQGCGGAVRAAVQGQPGLQGVQQDCRARCAGLVQPGGKAGPG